MRLTTLDIGTNTILALDARVDGDRLLALRDDMRIVRLGEGLDKSGRLLDAAMERALAVLHEHGERIRVEKPDCAAAIATAAVREAENGGEFLARACRALGIAVEIIDGEREARLSWVATTRLLPSPIGQRRTVLDIGGGSTELMVGGAGDSQPERAVSIPIGSVRLTERHVHHSPASDEERRALVATIDDALDHAPRPEAIVGIAGTVTSVCAIHLGLDVYDASLVHGRRLARADVESVIERLARSTQEERLAIPGLDPRRADVIFAGATILGRVLARATADGLIVSDRGIRWGLAWELAERALGRRLH